MSNHSLNLEQNETVNGLLNGSAKLGIGVHDGLSAILATRPGFDFVWVSSFETSAAQGLPDAGLLDLKDMLSTVQTVKRCTTLPVLVDLENGYGEPVKVFHAVRAMAEAGVAGVCLEDNTCAKRSSLYEGYERELTPVSEHVARIRAARLAIKEVLSSCALIARTEALVAGKSVDEALRRSHAYKTAGADAIFIQSICTDGTDVISFCKQWAKRTPVFLAPTKYPRTANEVLFTAGASHIIWANYGIRAAHRAMDEVFAELLRAGSAHAVEKNISTIREISESVGAQKLKEFEAALTQEPEPEPEETDHERNGSRRQVSEISLRVYR
jgi:phosphoenolpyruvate phosphomutase